MFLPYVSKMLISTSPSSVRGVNAVGSRGRLVVFCWGLLSINVIRKTRHYEFCKIKADNGNEWYVLFLLTTTLSTTMGRAYSSFATLLELLNYCGYESSRQLSR